MKKILITGADSYIGTSFENYVKHNMSHYSTYTLDTKKEDWQTYSFKGYDIVFHVAGIAHVDTGHLCKEEQNLYYEVNCNLAAEAANKAKAEGVSQFIFMSSAIVYGNAAPVGKSKIITSNTIPMPSSFYGDSKLKAEDKILPLQSIDFNVVILRPPMIYGKDCKGNYPLLSELAKKLPFFPYVNNSRSMLYIENLCRFICLVIENKEFGIFHPQNAEYVNTSQLVQMISRLHNKRVICIKGFEWALKLLSPFTAIIDKAFGNFCYTKELSMYKENYQVYSLAESIERTEDK